MARDRDDRDDDRDNDRGRGRDRDDDRGSKKKDTKTEVKLKNVRLSYEHIFRAASFNGDNGDDDGGKPKFSASFIFDPDTPDGKKNLALCEDAIDEAKFIKWGNKQPKLRDDKIALRNDKDQEEYDGMWYVSASSTKRPKVFDIDGSTPLAESDGVIYSGCYVNAIVRFWAQDNKWGKRVNASLEGVQYLEEGEAFGAPGIGDDAFEDESGRKSARSNGDGPRRSSRNDDDNRDRDRGRSRGDGDRDRGRDRDRSDSDDRASRSRSRDDDERSSRDDDDRSSRSRSSRNDDEPERGRDRGRSREDDTGDDDRRGRSRDRDDDPPSRSRRNLV